MGELLAPVFTEPTKPVRKYCVHLERDAVVPTPRVQTTQRMHTDQVTLNVPFDDKLDWKLELAEYTADNMEYRKDMKYCLPSGPAIIFSRSDCGAPEPLKVDRREGATRLHHASPDDPRSHPRDEGDKTGHYGAGPGPR